MASGKISVLTAALLLGAAAARADVSINNKPTANMSCASGVCTATAQKAVLNVTELANMLSAGDVAVKTGTLAKDIAIDQPLTWTSTSKLTLDAQQSVSIDKRVTVAGQGSLTAVTNDAGNNGRTSKAKTETGEFIVVPERGSVQFWDPSSSLVIDGQSYTLVYDIKTLAADIAANPSGFYALAKPYDASADGTYSSSPIQTPFTGGMEGLGNNVSNFVMEAIGTTLTGLFAAVDSDGAIRDVGVVRSKLAANGPNGLALLVGNNQGWITRCWAAGEINFTSAPVTGGLVGLNNGAVVNSSSNVRIVGTLSGTYVGGLVGYNTGMIAFSQAAGRSILMRHSSYNNVGGMVGENASFIGNSFARNHVGDGKQSDGYFGGLVGLSGTGARIENVYAAGRISRHGDAVWGGLIGDDEAAPGGVRHAYWDLDKGIDDPSQGAGNIPNDPGIKGLTTKQLQAGLPKGFDPKIWGIAPQLNNGFPYLLAIPPK